MLKRTKDGSDFLAKWRAGDLNVGVAQKPSRLNGAFGLSTGSSLAENR